jgi:hypothetical protein
VPEEENYTITVALQAKLIWSEHRIRCQTPFERPKFIQSTKLKYIATAPHAIEPVEKHSTDRRV